MANVRVQRRLAAILAADVVGYSRLMGEDEAGTRARFNAHLHELIEPSIASQSGRVVKTTGDGLLVEFASVVEAVQCAVGIQKGMAERNAGEPGDLRMEFRIGVNLGDVIIEGDDIHGDGVNVAARLEALAEPGGVCVSGKVFEEVRNKLSVDFEDMGEQQVKNIAEPVRAHKMLPDGRGKPATFRKKPPPRWRILASAVCVSLLVLGGSLIWWQPWVTKVDAASVERMAFPLPDRPSIAVLPFTNMSEDREQEHFADGIAEDIITDLAKVSGLFVIARNSTFIYKGKPVKIRQVAEDLGVRYVLEGSVRRSREKVRVTAQLIDAFKGNHVWAERYDRELKEIFSLQSDITRKVVSELAVTLKANEQERLFRPFTRNLEAYEIFLRARRLRSATRETDERAKRLFEHVVELDPSFAGGYAGLSYTHARAVRLGFTKDRKADAELALRYAQKALDIDQNFAWSLVALGGAYLANRDFDKAVLTMRRAVELNPNDADAHTFLANYLHWSGDGDEAVKVMMVARRLNPKQSGRNATFLGMMSFTARRYQDAINHLVPQLPIQMRQGNLALNWLAAAYAAAGETESARKVMAAYLQKHPTMTLARFPLARAYKRKDDRDHLLDALRQAGMPEK